MDIARAMSGSICSYKSKELLVRDGAMAMSESICCCKSQKCCSSFAVQCMLWFFQGHTTHHWSTTVSNSATLASKEYFP